MVAQSNKLPVYAYVRCIRIASFTQVAIADRERTRNTSAEDQRQQRTKRSGGRPRTVRSGESRKASRARTGSIYSCWVVDWPFPADDRLVQPQFERFCGTLLATVATSYSGSSSHPIRPSRPSSREASPILTPSKSHVDRWSGLHLTAGYQSIAGQLRYRRRGGNEGFCEYKGQPLA